MRRGWGGPPIFRGPPLRRGPGFGCLGLLTWLFPGLLGYLLGRASRDWQRETRQPPEAVDPLEIARRRYARGEITREEFEQIRRDLEASRAGEQSG